MLSLTYINNLKHFNRGLENLDKGQLVETKNN